MKNLFFLNKTTHNCEGLSKTKKKTHKNICKRTLDKEFERDWSVSLGAMLDDGHTENKKNIFLVSGIFRENRKCYVVGFECTIKPQNFIKIVGQFFRKSKCLIFSYVNYP